jgi:hypothetical protein
MQVLRLPPYPLSISYDVPEANSDYILVIQDSSRNVVEVEENLTSSSDSKIQYTLPSLFNTYDESYYLAIYDDVDGEQAEIVVEDNLEIMRPYVDPYSLGTTATEKNEYVQLEGLARAIIDAMVPGGFYFERSWYETTGNNTDFMPVWDRTYKILKAYENNSLVWDSSQDPQAIGQWNYLLTKDKTSIIKDWVQQEDSYIRMTGNPKGVPLAYSDSMYLYDTEDSPNTLAVAPGVTFPMGWNYLFSLEIGYKVVPFDIKDAVMMLIEDLKCGKLDYHKRYVSKYSTDQFRIEFEKESFGGTGNLVVDRILEKYITNFGTPGVL